MTRITRILLAPAAAAVLAMVATAALAQEPVYLDQPTAVSTTLTNGTYALILTNSTAGTVPVAVTIQNLGSDPVTITHTSTNNAVGYYLLAGQSISITEPTRLTAPVYGKLASGTSATVRALREVKK
jgi:hypothetical protein